MGVGSIVLVILMYALVQGVWIFHANESEMWTRDAGAAAVRAISAALQSAQSEKIYGNYTQVSGTDQSNGSCAVITTLPTDATAATVTYYWKASGSPVGAGSATLGQIYFHPNGGTALDPTTDKVVASNVTQFEFRRNPNGTVRVGFILGIFGYPRHPFASVEADLVRFSTSVLPRNP